MAAGPDSPARGPARAHPRDQAKARLSRTCGHVEQVHRSPAARTRIRKAASVWRTPRQRAKACACYRHAGAGAHLPQPVKQPKRHQSGGDDRGAQSLRFHRNPAGQAQVRRTGASLRSGEDHRVRVRRRSVERLLLPAGDKDRRNHRRGSARPLVLAFLRHAGARTRGPFSASPTRSWPACPGTSRTRPSPTRSTSRSWSRQRELCFASRFALRSSDCDPKAFGSREDLRRMIRGRSQAVGPADPEIACNHTEGQTPLPAKPRRCSSSLSPGAMSRGRAQRQYWP